MPRRLPAARPINAPPGQRVALGIAAQAVIEGRRAWAGTTCGCATCQ